MREQSYLILNLSMNTIEKLQSILPGQSSAWYMRIATEIDAGRMPMPSLTLPEVKSTPPPLLEPEVRKNTEAQTNQKKHPELIPKSEKQKHPITSPIAYGSTLSRDLLTLCRNDVKLALN